MLRNLFVTVLFRIFVGKFERKNVNQEDLLKVLLRKMPAHTKIRVIALWIKVPLNEERKFEQKPSTKLNFIYKGNFESTPIFL